MEIEQRIEGFCALGRVLQDYVSSRNSEGEGAPLKNQYFDILDAGIENASFENPWFTTDNILYAFSAIAGSLNRNDLEKWLEPYSDSLRATSPSKNVAVILAGNIPMVGFHDFLCTLLSGHHFLGRLSADDRLLLPAVSTVLTRMTPGLTEKINFTQDKLSGFDAVIATGSNNTSRYFEYYFSKYPHIIRKNRNAVAILTGDESAAEMKGLADDIFRYFGLGCRSVSKVYLPEAFDPASLFPYFQKFAPIIHHNKYCNNYEYHKAIYLVNQAGFLDSGFSILKEDEQLVSPISVLFYEKYRTKKALIDNLSAAEDQVQVIVCRDETPFRNCIPGRAQFPGLEDYADGTDTMEFLLGV